MRLWRRREITLPSATDAVAPTYTSFADFQDHALRYPANGWYEALPGYERKVGVVDRCLQLNSQQISDMELRYKHATGALEFEPYWVHDPDPEWFPGGIKDAVFAAVWSLYSHGDAFLYITSRYETGWPRTWTVLDAAKMKVSDEGGSKGYKWDRTLLNPLDVKQITRNPKAGELRGTSALEAYWANVASAYAAETYAADVYQSTGVNRMALKSKVRLTPEQAEDLQAQWVAAVAKRLGAPAIVPPDIEMMESLSVSPKDLMLLESRQWDATQIAAAFGVPAVLLNIVLAGGLVYQAPAQLFELWWRTELMAVAGRVSAHLSRWLPRGHWVEFDPSRALEPDIAAKVDVAGKAVAAGLLSLDEARAWTFDLPPLSAGDMADELFEEPGAHASELEVSA